MRPVEKIIPKRLCGNPECGEYFDAPHGKYWPAAYCSGPCHRASKVNAASPNMALIQRDCAVCGERFWPYRSTQKVCGAKCRQAKRLEPRLCVQCGGEYQTRRGSDQRFCSFRCRTLGMGLNPREYGLCCVCEQPFKREEKQQRHCSAACVKVSRERRPSLRWGLKAKGEDACRNCGRPASHLHHIVPRSKSKAGKTEIERNGMPLCFDCHRGWHDRRVVLHRGCLRPEEEAFATELAGEYWLDKNYPLPPDVELVRLYAMSFPGRLEAGWEARNAERIRVGRDIPRERRAA